MNCLLKTEEQMLAYCAGRLDEETANGLERHMETCPACAQLRGSQRMVWEALGRWDAPPVSSDFNRRLYARIDAASAIPWYRRWLESMRPVFAQPALPLAAAAMLIAGAFFLDHPSAKAPAAPARSAAVATATTATTTIRVSDTDAEQVEKTLDDLEMLRQFDVGSDQKSEDKEKTSKSM